jgi:hypothetical protein
MTALTDIPLVAQALSCALRHWLTKARTRFIRARSITQTQQEHPWTQL